jgi:hypothetical protein
VLLVRAVVFALLAIGVGIALFYARGRVHFILEEASLSQACAAMGAFVIVVPERAFVFGAG